MKKTLATFASATLLGLASQQTHASVVISNLDPATTAYGFNAPTIGQATLTGSRPISLTSVEFLQTGGMAAGETFALYSRNADGTVGSAVFTGFTLSFDPTTDVTTAKAGGFTLQANSGYFFVLSSGTTSNVEWSYINSTDYASAFGASLPANDDSFDTAGTSTVYYSLAAGPQEFQVNGLALSAVPEPSTWACVGLALAGGVAFAARRRVVAA